MLKRQIVMAVVTVILGMVAFWFERSSSRKHRITEATPVLAPAVPTVRLSVRELDCLSVSPKFLEFRIRSEDRVVGAFRPSANNPLVSIEYRQDSSLQFSLQTIDARYEGSSLMPEFQANNVTYTTVLRPLQRLDNVSESDSSCILYFNLMKP